MAKKTEKSEINMRKSIGQRLEQLRKEKGVTIEIVANYLNEYLRKTHDIIAAYNRSTICKMESGELTQNLTLVIIALAKYFGVTTDYLFFGREEDKQKNFTEKHIYDYTGLDEKAIEFLHQLSAKYTKPEIMQKIDKKSLKIKFQSIAIKMRKLLLQVYPSPQNSETELNVTKLYNLAGRMTTIKKEEKITDKEMEIYTEWRQNIINKENLETINLLLSSYAGLAIINGIGKYLNSAPDSVIKIEDEEDIGLITYYNKKAVHLNTIQKDLQEFYDIIHNSKEAAKNGEYNETNK